MFFDSLFVHHPKREPDNDRDSDAVVRIGKCYLVSVGVDSLILSDFYWAATVYPLSEADVIAARLTSGFSNLAHIKIEPGSEAKKDYVFVIKSTDPKYSFVRKYSTSPSYQNIYMTDDLNFALRFNKRKDAEKALSIMQSIMASQHVSSKYDLSIVETAPPNKEATYRTSPRFC